MRGTESGEGVVSFIPLLWRSACTVALKRLDVLALLQAGIVDGVADDGPEIGGKGVEGAGVGDEPEAVPDVVADRAVLLHLVELRHLDDRQRIFLRVDNACLERRIDLAELQAGRRRR